MDDDVREEVSAISTHAPAQGATSFRCLLRIGKAFQPTLPHRERLEPEFTATPMDDISTHAPAQGATFRSIRRS